MKKRRHKKLIQFWVDIPEHKKIYANMRRNNISVLSDFLRILALSEATIKFNVQPPTVMEVSEANLGGGGEEEKQQHRATG